MNGFNYLLQTNLYLLLFMGFYVLVLRNETFFRQNRFFLNTSIFLSFLIPFINSDWFRNLFITQKVREAAIMPTQMMYDIIIVGVNEEASSLSVYDAIFWIYTSGATFLLLRFFVRLAFLQTRLKAEKGAAFSFFNTLVVDAEIPKAENIIDHEKVHMRQWHSADIIFIELAAIVNWFNPIMYLYKKEIRHIHEFIADEEAARLMQNKSDYAMLLFSNTMGVDPLHLSNNFFNKSLLKRRILMLHKNRSRSTGLWKYGFSAPLFILMLIVSAAAVKSEEVLQPVAKTILSPLPSETSAEIMAALELNETYTKPILKDTESLVQSYSQNAGQSVPDYGAFKKHLMRNLKYPAFARQNDVTGFVVANVMIKDKKISSVSIRKGVQRDIDDEVIRSLSLYKDDFEAPDDTYLISISFNLVGSDVQADLVPNINGKNYIGQITVTALRPSKNLNVKDFIPGTTPANSVGLKEVVIDGDNTIKDFAAVDVLPEFPGGIDGWGRYLTANLVYPKLARDKNVTGRVIVSFIVEKDGSLSEIKVLRGIGSGADEEAVKVLTNSPSWRPGILGGRSVRVAFTMPIFFRLTDNTKPAKPGEVKPGN